MAIRTYTEQLEETQTAIQKIMLDGQSYTIGDRQFNRGNLDDLLKYEKFLRRMAARETRGGGVRFRGATFS